MTEHPNLSSAVVEIPDDFDLFFADFYKRGWTDGLPVVPPTAARVRAMLAYSDVPAQTEIGRMPPNYSPATIEKIAINAVMAGCLPSYFPVVIAAFEAMLEPQFNLLGVQTTTNPVGPLLIINGPIRHELEVNCGRGALGPGWRANATIGRAVRLTLINVGGAKPGDVDKATLGMPGKFSFCLGELEEESPWLPFHVDQGLKAEDSAVTVASCQGTQSVAASYLKPESILMMLANAMSTYGSNSYSKGNGTPVVILPPRHAAILNGQGWSKSDVKHWLYENTKIPLSLFPKETRLLDTTAHRKIDEGRACICARADDIAIVVAGGPEAYHAAYLPSYGCALATKRIAPGKPESSS